jgi:hypothetical protein
MKKTHESRKKQARERVRSLRQLARAERKRRIKEASGEAAK